MNVIKKMLKVTGRLVVVFSFVCGFVVGAVFGETVINKTQAPTALTYYLAGMTN
jgi:hypothetical protein